MSAAEIIAELARMNPDDLAAVRVWLNRQTEPTPVPPTPVKLRSPRLVDQTQAKDFIKHVVKPNADAGL